MSDPENWACQACGNLGLTDGFDGFFYCLRCNARADDFIETGVADEDFIDKGGDTGGALYLPSYSRRRNTAAIKAEPISQSDPTANSQYLQLFSNSLALDHNNEKTPLRHVKKEELHYDDDVLGPTGPQDFGSSLKVMPSYEDYKMIRIRYVIGLQLMVQFQCEALVREFNVSPLICGLAGTIWMRFLTRTGVFDDDWADQTIRNSEEDYLKKNKTSEEDRPENLTCRTIRAKDFDEPHNNYNQRSVIIWYRSLRKRIPLSCTLAVSFLACHIAREAILPTDIVKWSLEGKVPYLAAFVEIEKRIGPASANCPISPSIMFRPSQALPFQKLESLAATIAQSLGLDLPPVNFYAIASRYLQKFCLPIEKILPHVCRIYEWSMPPDLWLSTNELRLPTRVCVMSILIVAIRIIYNIHGFGEWEKSLSSNGDSPSTSNQGGQLDPVRDFDMDDDAGKACGSPCHDADDLGTNSSRHSSQVQKSELNAAELLHKLEARYNEIADTYEYSKDLPTYLQYCKDVVFAGLEPAFEDHEEKRLIEEFWDFYEKESEPSEDFEERRRSAFNQKRSRDEGLVSHMPRDNKKIKDEEFVSGSSPDGTYHVDESKQGFDGDQNSEPNDQISAETRKNEAIRCMKLDMEENRFYYIPPRVNIKRFDYLHYVRKKDEGAFTYVAHADYYILLRACARAAQVDIRIMHIGVLSLERRLTWLENRTNHCLHLTPPNVSCQFCSNVAPEHTADDPIGLQNLNI